MNVVFRRQFQRLHFAVAEDMLGFAGRQQLAAAGRPHLVAEPHHARVPTSVPKLPCKYFRLSSRKLSHFPLAKERAYPKLPSESSAYVKAFSSFKFNLFPNSSAIKSDLIG